MDFGNFGFVYLDFSDLGPQPAKLQFKFSSSALNLLCPLSTLYSLFGSAVTESRLKLRETFNYPSEKIFKSCKHKILGNS